MTLCRAAEDDFSPALRRRGASLERRLRVVRMRRVGSHVEASVADDDVYSVEIDWSDLLLGVVVADCTCARFAPQEPCEHVWAVLQAIDRSGYVTTRIPRDVNVWAKDEEEPDGAEIFGGDEVTDLVLRDRGDGPPKPSDWRELARVCRHGLPGDGDGEIAQPLAQRRYWWVLLVDRSVTEDAIRILCYCQRHRQSGGWGKARLELPPADGRPVDSELALDAEIARRVQDASRESYSHATSSYYSYQQAYGAARYPVREGYTVRGVLAAQLLPLLCRHERFIWLWSREQPLADGRRIHGDDGPAYHFAFRCRWDAEAGHWNLEGALCRGAEPPIPLDQMVAPVARRFVLFEDRLAPFKMPPVPAVLDWFRAHQTVTVAPADREPFLQVAVPAIDPEAVRSLPADLVGTIVDSGVEPELYIDPDRSRRETLAAQVRFTYGDVVLPSSGPRVHYAPDQDQVVIRDTHAERKLIEGLHEALAPQPGYRFEGQWLEFDYRLLPALVHLLLPHGWHVRIAGKRVRRAGDGNFTVRSDIDWFDVRGAVDFDGMQVPLPRLLRAVKEGENVIILDDGSRGLIPEDWLKRYRRLLEMGQVDGDAIRYRSSQALVLDALLAEAADVDLDAKFRRLRQQLRGFAGVKAVREPRGFHGVLRDYQRRGLGWLRFLNEFQLGGCLADDMGLGKTVQVLALLQWRRTRRRRAGEDRKPSLVVVPKSLVFNWIDEAARFAPRLNVLDYTGTGRHERRDEIPNYDMVVTTYGTLQRDIAQLREIEFDYAILDESTAIKNPKSQNAKACRLIRADHRLAMTGTPIENHLGELWSLFEFLNPGMLGSLTTFQSLTAKSASVEDYQWLAQAIGPFVLRRTKEEVISELPPKTEKMIRCEMSAKERSYYDELRLYYQSQLNETIRRKGLKRSKIHVLEALLRLRQAACHPALIDGKRQDEPSAKLKTLLELIEEVTSERHKVLVFSQFTSFLGIVRQRLDRAGVCYEYLDGQTRDRKQRVARFQNDDACLVFLISLKAGGHGLNLTAADYVFILDPWWNPAVEAQAVDRAHRIGQQRPVFAYRFVTKETVEDKVLQLQQQKRDLAEAIITANESLIRSMTAADLEMLLG